MFSGFLKVTQGSPSPMQVSPLAEMSPHCGRDPCKLGTGVQLTGRRCLKADMEA